MMRTAATVQNGINRRRCGYRWPPDGPRRLSSRRLSRLSSQEWGRAVAASTNIAAMLLGNCRPFVAAAQTRAHTVEPKVGELTASRIRASGRCRRCGLRERTRQAGLKGLREIGWCVRESQARHWRGGGLGAASRCTQRTDPQAGGAGADQWRADPRFAPGVPPLRPPGVVERQDPGRQDRSAQRRGPCCRRNRADACAKDEVMAM